MMTKLLEKVRGLVEAELADARSIHGEYFHSPHEGYGVLMEEVQEAADEANSLKYLADESLLRYVKACADGRGDALIKARLKNMSCIALKAACEYIQVAAMAQKMLESVEKLSE